MPGSEKVLAFPVYPGVTPLDVIGPLTVLKTPGIGGARYRTVVVGERAEQLATDTPLQMVPAATFAEVPDPWAVIVPDVGRWMPAISLSRVDLPDPLWPISP